jgi:hypothetical protein
MSVKRTVVRTRSLPALLRAPVRNSAHVDRRRVAVPDTDHVDVAGTEQLIGDVEPVLRARVPGAGPFHHG